jgi:N-acetylglucosaminyldiphosphoundecaprenol N-acetyl-beta-D-mannosaminyltransferase
MNTQAAIHREADRHDCPNVLGVRVNPLDLEQALGGVADFLRRRAKGYVCAVTVNGVLEALADAQLADAYMDAAMVIPDGRPMVWVGRAQGHRGIRQVTGPDMMEAIFSRPGFAGYSHFFYGGKPGVVDELAEMWMERFPGTRVAGTYTPPFRDLTPVEEKSLIDLIHQCRPDIIWIGIGAPRQELFMRRLVPHLHHGLLFGVGAAFDFHTGRIRDCAPWIKRIGFQWLHRLLQDPRRLWRRNLRNVAFLWHIALQLTGLKKYEPRPASGEASRVAAPQPASSSSAAGSA